MGGPRHAPRDTTNTTRPRFTAPRLGYQHGSGAGLLEPQIYDAATELGDKSTFTSPPQIQEKPNRNPSARVLGRRVSRYRMSKEQTVTDAKTYQRICVLRTNRDRGSCSHHPTGTFSDTNPRTNLGTDMPQVAGAEHQGFSKPRNTLRTRMSSKS